jgi:hypothetical protein
LEGDIVKLILTDEIMDVSPGVLLFSKERLAEILEFINDDARHDRDAELPNEAEAGEHSCPACSGMGHYLVGNFYEICPECEGTGQE